GGNVAGVVRATEVEPCGGEEGRRTGRGRDLLSRAATAAAATQRAPSTVDGQSIADLLSRGPGQARPLWRGVDGGRASRPAVARSACRVGQSSVDVPSMSSKAVT